MIPSAAAKLNKVTNATKLAETEVMDIVDNVINLLNNMTESIDDIEEKIGDGIDYKEKKDVAFDPNAEFNFVRSAESQRRADEYLEKVINGVEVDERIDLQSDSSASPKTMKRKQNSHQNQSPDQKLRVK